MRKLVLPALFFYIGTVAITQTVYGDVLMTARWIALSLVLPIAGSYWVSTKPSLHSRHRARSTAMVVVYLGITFLTVIMAENPLFSGMKWASHAAMIVVFLVFVGQSLNLKQIQQTLTVLKWLIAILIFLSWLQPTSPVWYDDIQLFRGAFGSPNSMGQVAAIGGLLFLHSFLMGKTKWLARAEITLACAAAWLVWSSGARSAMVLCVVGLVLLNYFYRGRLRGKVFWIIILAAGLALAVPNMPKAIKTFVLRGDTGTTTFSEQIFITRTSVWAAAWEGFRKRPLLGWGFGADDGISKVWEPKLTALGIVSRDNVNDALIVLESSGVVGLIGYILLVILATKQIPTRRERFLLRKIHAPPSISGDASSSAYHNHVIAFIIAASLLVTVQFDNTALSAGNFVSVTLWLCVALAGAIKNKAVLYESAMARYQQLSQRSHSRPFTDKSVPVSVVS